MKFFFVSAISVIFLLWNPSLSLASPCKKSFSKQKLPRVSSIKKISDIPQHLIDAPNVFAFKNPLKRRLFLLILDMSLESDFTKIATYSKDRYPLHLAIQTNDYAEFVNLLLKGKRVDLEKQDKDGLTPLHLAVGLNRVQIARSLMAKGVNPNIQSSYRFAHFDVIGLALALNRIEIADIIANKSQAQKMFKNLKREAPLLIETKNIIPQLFDAFVEAGININQLSLGRETYSRALKITSTQLKADPKSKKWNNINSHLLNLERVIHYEM